MAIHSSREEQDLPGHRILVETQPSVAENIIRELRHTAHLAGAIRVHWLFK